MQLWRKGPRGPGGHQADHEPALHSCGKGTARTTVPAGCSLFHGGCSHGNMEWENSSAQHLCTPTPNSWQCTQQRLSRCLTSQSFPALLNGTQSSVTCSCPGLLNPGQSWPDAPTHTSLTLFCAWSRCLQRSRMLSLHTFHFSASPINSKIQSLTQANSHSALPFLLHLENKSLSLLQHSEASRIVLIV